MVEHPFGKKHTYLLSPIFDFIKNKEAVTFLLLTLINLFVVFNYVDLRPHVDQNFFFSSDDPQFQSDKKLTHLFVRRDTQIIISATGDIASENYHQKIKQISDDLLKIRNIRGVKSLAYGPKNFQDAVASPLWKRLLISQDQHSS